MSVGQRGGIMHLQEVHGDRPYGERDRPYIEIVHIIHLKSAGREAGRADDLSAAKVIRSTKSNESELSCCRFRGHRDKVFLELEDGDATTEVRYEVRVCREAPSDLAGVVDMRSALCSA